MTDLKRSRTKENLMRAFAGESQARNRYTFAAGMRQPGRSAHRQARPFYPALCAKPCLPA